MTTFDHTYTPEGADAPVTITVPLPEGMLSAEAVAKDFMPKTGFASELSRRTDSILANKREDADYKTELLAHWGIDPDAKPDPNTPSIDDRLKTERASWDTATLKPVQDSLDTANTRIGKLLTSRLNAEILQASSAVKEPFRIAARAGAKPAIVGTVDGLFKYDAEHDSFFVRDGESFAFTKAPKDGSPPYMGVNEFMAEFLGRDANRELLDDRRQRGPGVGTGDGTGTGGEAAYTLTREQASDPARYRAASKAAKEAGQDFPNILPE